MILNSSSDCPDFPLPSIRASRSAGAKLLGRERSKSTLGFQSKSIVNAMITRMVTQTSIPKAIPTLAGELRVDRAMLALTEEVVGDLDVVLGANMRLLLTFVAVVCEARFGLPNMKILRGKE